MIRRAILLALAAATPAAAEEGGPIRGGEHADFTRLVMQVDPMTEWSLETGDGVAVIRFPGKPLTFSTGEVFDRIPRARIRSVTVDTGAGTTEIAVRLGCDCRISTSFVGARYLALDVADRSARPEAIAAASPLPETAESRERRETIAVATAERLLVQQIERAAGQGLVQLALTAPAAPPRRAAESRAPRPEPPAAAPVAAPVDPVLALDDHEQIDAMTVYDRDDAIEVARRARAAVPDSCLKDAELDIADWAGPGPWPVRRAALRSRLVGEFDRPDPASVRALARFYIRTGFGAEAQALLAGFPVVDGLDDRALLVDLARVVDGGSATADGPLSLAAPCPGRHALWLALGGAAPAYHDAATFADVDAAFAELPPDLRIRLGPRLIGRLLDAARPAEARRLLDAGVRDGAVPGAAIQLAEARTLAAEGEPEAALALLATLAAGRDASGLEALEREVRLALEAGLPLRDTAVIDLRTALHEQRGTGIEPRLRALLVEVLAARDEIPASVHEARVAVRALPGDAGRFRTLAVRVMAAAASQPVPPATFVDTVLEATDLIAGLPAADPARRAIAGRLVELGLPSPALRIVAPASASGDRAARLVSAEAEVALGRTAASRATLAGLNSPRSPALQTEAFALVDDDPGAFALARPRGGVEVAWPAGEQSFIGVETAEAPSRLTLAGYMTGAAPAVNTGVRPPDLALRDPLPDLSRPSLDTARRLLASGPHIGGAISEALAGDR